MIELFPKYVLLNILKEWITLKEVGKLDTAGCNVTLRSVLLQRLRQCEFEFSNCLSSSNEVGLVAWMVARNVKVDSISLKEESRVSPCISKLLKKHKFHRLLDITVICGPGYKSFNELLARSPDLQRLAVVNASCATVTTVYPMIKVCPNLLALSLREIQGIDAYACEIIAKDCKLLTELRLIKCETVTCEGLQVLLGGLSRLRTLEMNENTVSVPEGTDWDCIETIGSSASQLQQLTYIAYRQGPVHNDKAFSLSPFDRLQSLAYLKTNIWRALYHANRLPKLETLSVGDQTGPVSRGFYTIKAPLRGNRVPHLEFVQVQMNVQLLANDSMDDAELWLTRLVCSNLKTLSITVPASALRPLDASYAEVFKKSGVRVELNGERLSM